MSPGRTSGVAIHNSKSEMRERLVGKPYCEAQNGFSIYHTCMSNSLLAAANAPPPWSKTLEPNTLDDLPPQHILLPSSRLYRVVRTRSSRQIAVHLQPICYICAIALQPRNLGADSIEALSQRLVKPSSRLVGEELFHSLQLLLICETRGAYCDHGSEKGQSRRQLLDKLIPVVSHAGEESFDAVSVATKTRCGHIYVLVLDFAAKEELQGSLDKLWFLGPTEAAESSITLVTVRRCTVEVEDSIVLVVCQLLAQTVLPNFNIPLPCRHTSAPC